MPRPLLTPNRREPEKFGEICSPSLPAIFRPQAPTPFGGILPALIKEDRRFLSPFFYLEPNAVSPCPALAALPLPFVPATFPP